MAPIKVCSVPDDAALVTMAGTRCVRADALDLELRALLACADMSNSTPKVAPGVI